MGVRPSRALSALVAALVIAGGVRFALAADDREAELTTSRVNETEVATTRLSATERTRAQAWGLSEVEWRRYGSLMQGIRGSISPATLSPIEVLGIHARDDAERRRYAERWAVMMREDAERILAFQRAYDEAGRRLFAGETLIDPLRLPRREAEASELEVGDRVLLFTEPGCAPCDAVLERLLGRLEHLSGVDIYLGGVTPGDEAAVRAWAAEHGIRPEWVLLRQVTLNFEGGALERLVPGAGSARPYLLRRRGDTVAVLPTSAL